MFFTPRSSLAGDLVAGIEYVERLEGKRTIELLGRECETPRVVLIAHSNGGQLAQYVLSRKLAKVHAFCMFAAVPGFGSYVLSSSFNTFANPVSCSPPRSS